MASRNPPPRWSKGPGPFPRWGGANKSCRVAFSGSSRLRRLHRPRPLPGVGRSQRLLRVVEVGFARLRLHAWHRFVLDVHGRLHDQGPLGGEKTGKKPTDRAKKGVKRSQLVDGEGIPIGLAVDWASRPDMKLMRETRKKGRRWVVEQTHSWLNRFRGILIRWNKKP